MSSSNESTSNVCLEYNEKKVNETIIRRGTNFLKITFGFKILMVEKGKKARVSSINEQFFRSGE